MDEYILKSIFLVKILLTQNFHTFFGIVGIIIEERWESLYVSSEEFNGSNREKEYH